MVTTHMAILWNLLVASWVLSIVLVCTVDARFVVEKESISVLSPLELRSKRDGAIGNFGVPVYGGSMVGAVVYPDKGFSGCNPFDGDKPFKSKFRLPVILLLDRGDCYFAKKVWNGQQAGAAAVLVADSVNEPLITMDSPEESSEADGYIEKIEIPSALIERAFGESLKAALKKGDEGVVIKLDWSESMPHPDERVEYELWTNSNDECGIRCDEQMNFVKDFKGHAQILEKGGFAQFTPHYITWYCPRPFVLSSQCKSQCINHGRYCAPDPEQDFGVGYQGKDVVYENLRQLCVHRVANETNRSWVWWDYVTDFHIRCSMKKKRYSKECAEDVMKSLDLPIEKIKTCMGNPEADVVNEVLKLEQELQVGRGSRGDVTILPTLVINNVQYRGKLERTAVLKAVCAGYKETTEPRICLSADLETNECLEKNGGFSGFANNKSGNGFMSEEELRSDPAYLSYYYSNVNLNPRLPPPLMSKEDWRFAQRLQGGSSASGGIGDRRKVNRNDSGGGGRSLFSMPPGFGSKKGESETDSEKVHGSGEWGGDGLIGLPGLGLGGKQKSLAEIFQDDLGRASPASRNPSRPASRNAFENSETLGSADADLVHLHSELASTDTMQSNVNVQSSSSVQNVGPPASYSYAAALGASLSRSTTPDPQLIARAPSPCLAPIGGERVSTSEKRSINASNSFNSVSTPVIESADLVTAFSGLNLSNGAMVEENHLPPQIEQDVDDHQNYLFNLQSGHANAKQHPYMKKSESGSFHRPFGDQSSKVSYLDSSRSNGAGLDLSNPSPNKSYVKGSPASTLNSKGSLPSHYQHMDSANSSYLNYGLGGYSINTVMPSMMASNLPPLYENVAAASAMAVHGLDSRVLGGGLPSGSFLSPTASESQNLNRIGNQMAGNALQAPLVDPMYLQFLRTGEYAAAQAAALNDPSMDRNYLGDSYMDLLQKAYLGSLLSPQKSQYGVPMGTKSGGSNHHGYYGTPAYGVGLSYPGSPLASPVIPNSPGGPGSPMRHGELNMQYPSVMRNLAGGVMGPWHLQAGCNVEDIFASSLLEEFKSNKTKCFELSEITGHVVEFSADQYGSRFIQQKLETATTEEKNMVFEEIFPQALTLMTDVFGNYVIQKFFEHGFVSQRRELANNLFGHVLTLSLQMYGCRVIQKAIEVVDLDQKIKMVEELDGHVMRCVRDQNGNHVIQKCIECVPEEHIQFIVSTFFDQVVTLSTHPYGCRVVQRILEHCGDPKTQSKVMDEILGSVSLLAQDQYGNYVVQHVLEHGKPHERSTIIKELAGKIVQMSQQKFASNVVEKCLSFGGPSERQLLVNEMLGSTDENEPLQAMMKDQFANYVVQKVLETCDDQQRELILSRIKVHLNALKKYTYGKHIVARVEKLVAAGERRIAAQSTHSAYIP